MGNTMAAQKPSDKSVTHMLSTLKDQPLINYIKGHHLVKPCSRKKPDEWPITGGMVWARDPRSVFWPAFIAKVEDKEDAPKDGEDGIDDDSYRFVVFLEKTFRVAPLPWHYIIPFRTLDDQIPMVLNLNKKVIKKSWRPTMVYKRSLDMIEEFCQLPAEERTSVAERKYEEYKQTKKNVSASNTSDTKKPKTDLIQDASADYEDVMSRADERRSIGLRVSERVVKKKTGADESQGVIAKTDASSEETAAKTPKPKKNPRPNVGGEELKKWTKERFDTFDKQMMFDTTKPLRCHACTHPFEGDYSNVKMCHSLPHHAECLISQTPAEGSPPTFKCKVCMDHLCFICKQSKVDSAAIKCSRCDLRFHTSCLTGWPQAEIQGSNGPIICPLHFCHTCIGEQRIFSKVRDYTAVPSKVFRCFLCLSTYHKACLPAGCGEDIEGKDFITCPRHKVPELRVQQRRVGCLTCCKTLTKNQEQVECLSCIQSFHPECVGYTQDILNTGVTVETFGHEYRCLSCTWGLYPVYGQVVWFQQTGSQYWPARILYPKEAKSRNIFARRQPGQFSLEYFGETSFYDNASRAMPLHLATLNIFKSMKVYREIPKTTRAYEEAAFCLTFSEAYRDSLLPPPKPVYKKIDRNVYRNVKDLKTKEPTDICSCTEGESKSGPVCLPDMGCTNRDMEMECSDKTCNGGDRCTNRMFKDRKNDEDFIQEFLIPKKGWGVVAKKKFKAGDFVAEYRGEVIDRDEMTWRLNRKVEEDPLYILETEKGCFIDAEFVGSLSRLINHACTPNCAVRKYLSMGRPVGGIFAIADIEEGEEVTFTYGYGNETTAPFRCHCGSKECTIFVGKQVPDGFQVEDDTEEQSADTWDDVCLKCGYGGTVICCEYTGCKKVCHYQCAGLSRPPRNSWYCADHPANEIQSRKHKPNGSRITKKSKKPVSKITADKRADSDVKPGPSSRLWPVSKAKSQAVNPDPPHGNSLESKAKSQAFNQEPSNANPSDSKAKSQALYQAPAPGKPSDSKEFENTNSTWNTKTGNENVTKRPRRSQRVQSKKQNDDDITTVIQQDAPKAKVEKVDANQNTAPKSRGRKRSMPDDGSKVINDVVKIYMTQMKLKAELAEQPKSEPIQEQLENARTRKTVLTKVVSPDIVEAPKRRRKKNLPSQRSQSVTVQSEPGPSVPTRTYSNRKRRITRNSAGTVLESVVAVSTSQESTNGDIGVENASMSFQYAAVAILPPSSLINGSEPSEATSPPQSEISPRRASKLRRKEDKNAEPFSSLPVTSNVIPPYETADASLVVSPEKRNEVVPSSAIRVTTRSASAMGSYAHSANSEETSKPNQDASVDDQAGEMELISFEDIKQEPVDHYEDPEPLSLSREARRTPRNRSPSRRIRSLGVIEGADDIGIYYSEAEMDDDLECIFQNMGPGISEKHNSFQRNGGF